MTLGRTSANKIKIKTDGDAGLRAVECGCCGCTGMFKVAGVDFPMPFSTATLTQIGDWSSYPTMPNIFGYGEYTSLNTAPSAFGALGLKLLPSQTGPLNALDFYFGEMCGTGWASFSTKFTQVQISLPTTIYASGEWGFWECNDGGFLPPNTKVILSGTIPVPEPTPPTCNDTIYDDDGNEIGQQPAGQASWFPDNSLGVFTGQNYQMITGIASVFYTELTTSRISVENLTLDAFPYIGVGTNGVILKNLETQQTFPATSNLISGWNDFDEFAAAASFRPDRGVMTRIAFSGFSRAPGNYELTWPLLKSPFRFTIP